MHITHVSPRSHFRFSIQQRHLGLLTVIAIGVGSRSTLTFDKVSDESITVGVHAPRPSVVVVIVFGVLLLEHRHGRHRFGSMTRCLSSAAIRHALCGGNHAPGRADYAAAFRVRFEDSCFGRLFARRSRDHRRTSGSAVTPGCGAAEQARHYGPELRPETLVHPRVQERVVYGGGHGHHVSHEEYQQE